MERSLVITLSGKANCGKDTTAYLIKKNCEIRGKKVLMLAYADFVKIVCARNFGYDESNKEATRKHLQHFGTDIVRKLEPDFWVRQVFHMIDVLRNEYDCFVITDARYDNELGIRPYNLFYPIVNVFIDRQKENELGQEENAHSSEQMASSGDLSRYHYVLNNDGSIEDLAKQVDDVLFDMEEKVTNTREFIENNHSENLFATLPQEETIEELIKVINGHVGGEKNA